jgi:hypothetical protein
LFGSMWLLVGLLLIIWWREGRVGLIRRAFTWGVVAWLTIFNLLLMPWERSRRLLVPAPSARGHLARSRSRRSEATRWWTTIGLLSSGRDRIDEAVAPGRQRMARRVTPRRADLPTRLRTVAR